MGTVDNNPIAKIKKTSLEKMLKRRENKQILINQILHMISSNMYDYEDLCLSLVEESLQKRTQKELKEFL